MMFIPRKKIASIIVAGAFDDKAGRSKLEDLGGQKLLVSYPSNDKPEDDRTVALRDAGQRIMAAFRADDVDELVQALKDFTALCSYDEDDEMEGY